MTSGSDQVTQTISSSPRSMSGVPSSRTQDTQPSIPINSTTLDDANEPSIPQNSVASSRKSRGLTSSVWNHFKKVKVDGVEKAECLHCHQKLCALTKNGTSSLWDHIKVRCSKKHVKVGIQQQLLNYNRKSDGTTKIENHNFNQEVSRKELASMIIVHEYPLSIVDHIGFKRYSASLNPNFKMITRPTLKSDIMKMFDKEKTNLRNLFVDQVGRVAITTDLWTASHQKKGYMAITSHFIDHQWNLQNKTLRFAYLPCPHTSEILADFLLETLEKYNIHEKVSSVVVDNCSTNDKMIELLQRRCDKKSLLLKGAFLHLRCSAHILNLIVQDGLDVIASGIVNVRSCVSFWCASPKRVQMFEDKAKILKIDCSKKLMLDCKTRWNSTYFMLQTALPYRDVFEKLKVHHNRFNFDIPSDDEWQWIENICSKLSKFHKVTEIFSGRNYPTSNLFFRKVCVIKLSLLKWCSSDELMISDMAGKMIEKFDKYWSSISGVLAIAAILDPRDKLECVEWYFNKIYGDKAFVEIEKVKTLMLDLLYEYQDLSDDIEEQEYVSSTSRVLGKRHATFDDDDDDDFGQSKKSRKKKATVSHELDYYLQEAVLPDSKDFDVLKFWKIDLKFPTLRKIAKDILAIPVSTVASESAFSMGGRVVSPHRSRLHGDTVEALMCLQSWIGSDYAGFVLDSQDTILEDVDVEDSAMKSYNRVVEVDRYIEL